MLIFAYTLQGAQTFVLRSGSYNLNHCETSILLTIDQHIIIIIIIIIIVITVIINITIIIVRVIIQIIIIVLLLLQYYIIHNADYKFCFDFLNSCGTTISVT